MVEGRPGNASGLLTWQEEPNHHLKDSQLGLQGHTSKVLVTITPGVGGSRRSPDSSAETIQTRVWLSEANRFMGFLA